MTTDELREAVARLLAEESQDDFKVGKLYWELVADKVLAIPAIAEALAQKAYAERMMSHSTGGSSEQTS